MNEIYSFVQPDRSDKIYACGFRWKDAKTTQDRSTASMFKMNDQGEVLFLYMFGSRDTDQYDTCRGIDYDVDNREIVLIMEVTSPNLRPDYYLYS
jgi:1,4-alpha-glucan branching enzyme